MGAVLGYERGVAQLSRQGEKVSGSNVLGNPSGGRRGAALGRKTNRISYKMEDYDEENKSFVDL